MYKESIDNKTLAVNSHGSLSRKNIEPNHPAERLVNQEENTRKWCSLKLKTDISKMVSGAKESVSKIKYNKYNYEIYPFNYCQRPMYGVK